MTKVSRQPLVFLSYSHKDRSLAHKVKSHMSSFGFDVFLAHEDISPSADWQRTILKRLEASHIFIPILTGHFCQSDWTDQETGIAVAQGKEIVPLKVTTNPYGFIATRQALKINKHFPGDACWKIVKSLAGSKKTIGKQVRESLIRVFHNSSTFDIAAANTARLTEIDSYSDTELNEIVQGAAQNQNIYGGFRARRYMHELISSGKDRIKKRLVSAYRKRVKAWG